MSNYEHKSFQEHFVDFLFSLVIIGTLLAVIFAGISGAVLFRAAVFAPSPEPPAEASPTAAADGDAAASGDETSGRAEV